MIRRHACDHRHELRNTLALAPLMFIIAFALAWNWLEWPRARAPAEAPQITANR